MELRNPCSLRQGHYLLQFFAAVMEPRVVIKPCMPSVWSGVAWERQQARETVEVLVASSFYLSTVSTISTSYCGK